MGTMVAVDIADPLPPARLDTLVGNFFAWMREVDERFSTYRDGSELNRLARGELSLAGCSTDLRAVLDACADAWRRTGGYFDVYATGRLDPSGYVKGWAAEVASRRLLESGSANHFVNAGGDVRVRGRDREGRPWRIGLRHPWHGDGVFQVLAGSDLGVATSGTYERGFHVIDPYTGVAATLLRSVTVAGPDLGRADAYATAAVAMGEPALGWLARLAPDGYESVAVTEDGRRYETPGLPAVPETECGAPAAPPGTRR